MTVEVGLPQVPAWQVSPELQASLSLQTVPLATGGLVHRPASRLQVPTWWHWSSGEQSELELHAQSLVVGVQMPAWQLSPSVHARPSLHPVPSVALGLEQSPVAVEQMPDVWH